MKIAIEGCDGAGKATITEMLAQYLTEMSKKSVARVSFPRYRETAAGEILWRFLKSPNAKEYNFLNMAPKAASLLYASDRRESLPYLQTLIQSHDVLIFDRYVESNMIHQGSKLEVDEQEAFAEWISHLEYGEFELPRPDIIFYLSLPFEISMKRAKLRAESEGRSPDIGEDNVEYMRTSALTGKRYAAQLGWQIIDCMYGEREATREEVFESILYILQKSQE